MSANPFESGARKAIPAVLVYVHSTDGRILMVHRVDASGAGRAGDYHSGKWNGLGGKLELDESPLEGARRELREEAGLDLPESAFRSLGAITFPNFKAHKNEDWLVFVFSVRVGEPAASIRLGDCPEGQLHWVPKAEVPALSLWAGDRHFIHHVIEERPFMGTIWYRGQDVIRAWIQV